MIISENTSRECSASKQHSHVEAQVWQSSNTEQQHNKQTNKQTTKTNTTTTKISKIFLENEIQILQEKNSTFLYCILRFSRALKAEI